MINNGRRLLKILLQEHFINEKSLIKAQDVKNQINNYLSQIEKEKLKEGKLTCELKNKLDLISLERVLNRDTEDSI